MSAPANNPPRRSELFEALLPAGIATAELTGVGDPESLLDGERQLVGHAAPVRRREFAAGRLCARYAAKQFGIVDCAIGARDDRRPRWPHALTGSITHTDGFSAAAVGERSRFRAIGIDAERIGCVSRDMWGQLLLPAEADWLESKPAPVQASLATLLFSAKEAFYKCQYEVTQQWLEFRDVTLDFFSRELDRNSLALCAVGRVQRVDSGEGRAIVRFAFTDELVLTAVTLPAL